ncbi:MAG TPA: hypothetical protein VGI93_00855 [Steroidobacteraceae bacterium]|jgi:cobalamin synthase
MNSAPPDSGVRQLLEAMRSPAPTRYAALVGLVIGAIAGTVYWFSAELWPSSIAVTLAMLVSALLTNDFRIASSSRLDLVTQFFYLLLKYNALMALSAAKLPFPAPAPFALPLIMVCGYGASRALLVSLMASVPQLLPRVSHLDLVLALVIGLSPAVLLAVPGLVGLAVAIVSSIAVGSYLKLHPPGEGAWLVALAPLLAEICFYLGARASWSYVN